MAGQCDVCHRVPGFGHNRSFSLRATNRRWNLNVQRHRMVDKNGVKKPVRICTRCLRTQMKKAAQ